MQTKHIQLIESGEVITQTDFFNAHPTVAFPQPLTDDALADFGARLHVPEAPIPDRAFMARQIDEAVATVYGRFTPFQLEYTEREAQAQAFKDATYTGEVPTRVSEFAVPAGMTAQAATDLILSQAANLRTAQGALSALRMRKYEVLRAASDAEAQTVASEILAGIATVGAQVS